MTRTCDACGLPLGQEEGQRGGTAHRACQATEWKRQVGYDERRRHAYRSARARGLSSLEAAQARELGKAHVPDPAQLRLDLS